MRQLLSSSCILWLILIIVQQLQLTKADITELWSLEHLTDMIMHDAFRTKVLARSPAVIGLYDTPCKSKLYNQIGFTDRNLPDLMDLLIAVFDRKKVKESTWMHWYPEKMDIFEYYNISTTNKKPEEYCPTIIFQPINWNDSIQIYNPKKDGDFHSWIMKQLIMNITINNNLESDLLVFSINNGNNDNNGVAAEMLIDTIPSQSSKKIEPTLYIGDNIIIRNKNNEFVTFHHINGLHSEISINEHNVTNNVNYENFMKKYTKTYENELKLRRQRDWSTRRRYLENLRSPLVMPNFTTTGFHQQKLPDYICSELVAFYNEQTNNAQLNHVNKKLESFPKDGTQINTREIPTYMINLPNHKKEWLAQQLKPVLEQWSNQSLVYSTMYGLREYRRGAVLKGHVDRVETHIVSAILHIAHGQDDELWPLELISYDGKRYYVKDDVCDMIFYESSKLIHGRPSPFNGTYWVNAFLHFRPSNWDGYEFTPDNVIVTPQKKVSLVDWIYG